MSAWRPHDGDGDDGAAGVDKCLEILEIVRRQMIKSVGVLPVVMVILTNDPTRLIAQLFRWKTIEQTTSHAKSSVLSILGLLP
jgi:hypothetical protein